MKLKDVTNIASPGDDTNLSGGKLPNAYTDNADTSSKRPRTKKKDVYGTNGIATGVDSGGDGGGGGE